MSITHLVDRRCRHTRRLAAGLMAALVLGCTGRSDGYALPFRAPLTPAEGLVPSLPGKDPATVIKIVGPDGSTG